MNPALTTEQHDDSSMEDKTLWYLSGAVDSLANLKVAVQKHDKYEFGYRMTPEVSISRPYSRDAIFGLLDEYCTEVSAVYYMDEGTKSSHKMVIENPDGVERFLKPIVGGFIQQYEDAELLLDEILPLLKDGQPQTKEEFIEVVEIGEKIRENPDRLKYTAEYFREEWGISP